MNNEQKKFILQVFAGIAVFVTVVQLAYQSALAVSELALYIGLFIGVYAKVIIPFIRKIQEGKITSFSIKYFWTSVISFFYLLPVSYGIVQYINIGNLPWSLAFVLGAFIGLGGNWTTEEVTRYFLYLKQLYKELEDLQESSSESAGNLLPITITEPVLTTSEEESEEHTIKSETIPKPVPVIVSSKNEEENKEEEEENKEATQEE